MARLPFSVLICGGGKKGLGWFTEASSLDTLKLWLHVLILLILPCAPYRVVIIFMCGSLAVVKVSTNECFYEIVSLVIDYSLYYQFSLSKRQFNHQKNLDTML